MRVILLTPVILFLLFLNSCSILQSRYGVQCKSHAHINNDPEEYLADRFDKNAQVRLGIFPFKTQENITSSNASRQGWGKELAMKLQGKLLEFGTFPIIEVVNRDTWENYREEFSSGNYRALSMARELGYDLLLVGDAKVLHYPNKVAADVKLIETESGITVWYGNIEADNYRKDLRAAGTAFGLFQRDPSINDMPHLSEKLAKCTAGALMQVQQKEEPGIVKNFFEEYIL
jgi:TolB-like protein